jgi:hypothetical protein
MIPHISKLKDITTLEDPSQYYFFGKYMFVKMIPTIYDENNPYYNTINNEYIMIIWAKDFITSSNNKDFSSFMSQQQVTAQTHQALFTSPRAYMLYFFKVSDKGIDFIDSMLYQSNTTNFLSIDLRTKQNLILDGLNVVGIKLKPSVSNITNQTTVNIGNIFRVEFDFNLEKTKYINEYYKYPQEFNSTLTYPFIGFFYP